MSQEFSISVNTNEFLRFTDRLSDFSGIAENDATKRATKALERYFIDGAKKTVKLKVGRIKKGLNVKQRSGTISISGRAPTLFQFLTPAQQRKLQGNMYREPNKKGIAVRVFKDRPRQVIEGAFLIRGRSGNPVVVRRKDKRNPNSKLEGLYGRWVRDLWEVPDFRRKGLEVTREKYAERFTSTFDKLKKGII